jgi:hypothetical protein
MPRTAMTASTAEALRTFGPFPMSSGPALLQVDTGTGTVVAQCLHGATNWITFLTPVTDADSATRIEVAGMESVRIVATGNATFVFVRPN